MTPIEFSQTIETLSNTCNEIKKLLDGGKRISRNNLKVEEFDRLGSQLADVLEDLRGGE